jgi:microcystin-dependent protein
MAYEGRSPDSEWIQLAAKTALPSFPATATDAYKEGTVFYSNATGTAPSPKGLYVYTTSDGTATGTWGFQTLSPNNNATLISTGNLAPEFGGVPCGTIVPFAKDVISSGLPTGWLLCDGSAISRTSYATLYAVVGNWWGDGSTGTGSGTGKFNLPDFRGFFMRGMLHTASSTRAPDSASRTSLYTTGLTAGGNIGTYEAHALESHTHTYKRMDTHNFGQSGTANPEFESDTQTSTPNGANVSTETRPNNIYVEYIIRYL